MMRIGQVQLPLILWWASLVHTGLGISVLIDNDASAVLLLVGLHDITNSLGPDEIGALLIFFSILAAVGLMFEHKIPRTAIISLLLPQYFLLIASFVSDVWLILDGFENSRGQQVPTPVIFAALWAVMAGSILHTIGIVERYFWKWTIPPQ